VVLAASLSSRHFRIVTTQTGVPKKGLGCFFYGCLGVVLAFLFVLAGVYFGVRYTLRNVVERFTEPAPIAIPSVTLTDREYQELSRRFERFQADLESKTNAVLELTDRELNGYIARAAAFQKLRGKLHVQFEDDQARAQVSFPLDQLGWKHLQNRYLNGDARFKLILSDEALAVKLLSMNVRGHALPENVLRELQSQILTAGISEESDTNWLKRIRGIELLDGKLILRGATAELPLEQPGLPATP
jgi:hypothetical protein